MKTQTVKGFQDFVGAEAAKRMKIRKIILKDFELYGFEPTESPTIEFEEFVKKGASEDTISEIFRLEDRGKRKLALKYESTFQLKRLARNQRLPFKRFEIARVFRDEPVSSNRFREFTHCDVDVVGSSLRDEAEVLSLVKSILDELGIESVVYFNNRKLLNEIMVGEDIEERNRERVIRELDKLDKLSRREVADNLKKIGAERILKVISGDLTKYNFYGEVKELIKLCKAYGMKLKFSPTLARGLAYYNGTIFEVKTAGMKETVCGGGAYLVNEVQAFGFAFGLDRLCVLSGVEGDIARVLVLSLGEDDVAIGLASKLRENGVSVNLLMDKAIGKGLEYANAKGIGKVIFVGKEEVGKKKFRVKDMASGDEELVSERGILGKLR
ncbi:histidine--tRNA ligase [Candidatus Pacearchaeota archaeon]|nr:histidine--tRNA ligase [Candidatus Pacearchaeota archaeon]